MSKARKQTIICYGITLCIFVAIFLWGRFGSITGDELGYSLLGFYIIMPLTSLIIGLVMGIKCIYLKWFYPVVFGILGFFIPVFVFEAWTAISLFFSLIPAFLGVLVGWIIYKVRKK
ncbi:hypothetical protein LQZ18_06195 [Lachnospiraceae bacterium ZAX-1]